MDDTLYSKWVKVGYGFTDEPYSKEVDLEELIILSTLPENSEPRLFWGTLTWIIQNGSLINVSRLIGMLDKVEGTARLGCLIELAIENKADRKLKSILRHCRPKKKKSLLFDLPKRFKMMEKGIIKEGLPIPKKWGFYIDTITVKKEVCYSRESILKANRFLAIRSLFGPNTKAEILFALLNSKRTYIRDLVRQIKSSYQPVYKEVMALSENGYLELQKIGNMQFISLKGGMEKLLKAIPI